MKCLRRYDLIPCQLAPSRWGAAMALYMISFTSHSITIAFFAALYPQLARNTPHSRQLKKRRDRGGLSAEAYEKEKSIEESRISSFGMVRSPSLNLLYSSIV